MVPLEKIKLTVTGTLLPYNICRQPSSWQVSPLQCYVNSIMAMASP